jgi:hypothetical protein
MPRKRTERLSPLTENVVKAVIARYLTDIKKVKVKPTRGAGPDFVFDGQIIETKGAESDFDRAIKQMLDYAPKYRSLAFALPVGFFTAQRVLQLNALAKIIYKQYMKMLTAICVVSAGANMYTVGELQLLSLAYNVAERIGDMNEWTYTDTSAKPENYEADRIREIDVLVRAAVAHLTKQTSGSCTIVMLTHC